MVKLQSVIKIIIIISLANSIFLLPASHPVAIILIIIRQTLTACTVSWLISPTGWFSFILFLIFIGGLIVLFIYITRLAANEKFIVQAPNLSPQTIISLVSLIILIFLLTQTFTHPGPLVNLKPQLSLMFSNPILSLTILIIIYLLVTLIVAVKIANKIEGPLRNIIKRN